ncbi:tRNA uridine-5-carboxymethylaminomethyl(34) synthesis GTPase MnmE [Marinibaculum pumilum]|uniref:tRNA modification GTPase MnmE n=1 Tax=Marinibaculum pumilum TaxID=1766165 RepID=A0ABV7KVX1_9PROT
MDTIFALASGSGTAGVAVYRLSGPAARAALEALTGRAAPPPRQAVLRRLRDRDGGEIDRGLVLWFPAPASFTGEDVAELHLHGGRAVRAALYRALQALPGCRPAEAGEFTRRAFENGLLDLTQAEGLADLVAAETEGQRRQALRQMGGALAALYEGWRAELVDCLALLESDIDFTDEDLPDDVSAPVFGRLADLAAAMRSHLADGHRGERLREGVRVAIVGPPNVGKSSLLNALARREVAIVTDIAGTTRDVLEVVLDLDGVPAVVADTAGLRCSSDAVEQEGVRRAMARATADDVRLLVLDSSALPADAAGFRELLQPPSIVVANKADLAALPDGYRFGGSVVLPLSVRSGEGIGALLDRLSVMMAECAAPTGEAGITRERHRHAVAAAADALDRAAGFAGGSGSVALELVAEDVRLAARSLGTITGRVDVEEILGAIFSRFCIGK